MKRNPLYAVMILFGILVFATLVVIFTPAIFGTISSGSEIEKYQGTSNAGNDTIRASQGADSITTAMYSIPASSGFLVFVIICLVIVVIVMYRMIITKGRKGKI